jgi:mitofilin
LRKSEPRPKPLPLITPELAQYGTHDLIIVQLASTIDNLASYLKPSSSTSSKAQAVLETAKMDLTQLANRLEKIREEGQSSLEQKLDEQTKEFTLKLLELEMEARDQLETEKEGYSDVESAQFRTAFRIKVDEELRRQTERMNEQ